MLLFLCVHLCIEIAKNFNFLYFQISISLLILNTINKKPFCGNWNQINYSSAKNLIKKNITITPIKLYIKFQQIFFFNLILTFNQATEKKNIFPHFHVTYRHSKKIK